MRSDSTRGRFGLSLFIVLNLLDILTTHVGLAAGIPEGNPVPAFILASAGEPAMYAAKLAVCAVIILSVLRLHQYCRLRYTLYIGSAILLFVVASNLSLLLA